MDPLNSGEFGSAGLQTRRSPTNNMAFGLEFLARVHQAQLGVCCTTGAGCDAERGSRVNMYSKAIHVTGGLLNTFLPVRDV